MTREDGRAADELRPVTITRNWLDHAAGLVPDRVRQDQGAVRRERQRGRAALAQGLGPRLGHRRVRDAAAGHPRPLGPRVGQGPHRRTHARDLPPRRPLAAHGDRLQGARREHHHDRLRRAAGRRRHPHRGHHRRVRRAGRRRRAPARPRAPWRASRSSSRSPRSASASSTACRCSTCRTSRTSAPRPT